MQCHEAMQFLYPYFDIIDEEGMNKKNHANFIIDVVRYCLNEDYHLSCNLLGYDSKYFGKIWNGTKPISVNDASLIVGHQTNYIATKALEKTLTNDADSVDELSEKLIVYGYYNNNERDSVADACYRLIIDSIRERTTESTSDEDTSDEEPSDLEIAKKIAILSKKLHKPTMIDPPEEIQENEKYVDALLAAYGDSENLPNFGFIELERFDEYKEDLQDRRIDYYAAESIRRGLLELHLDTEENPFEELKKDTYSGVKDTHRRRYPNGYEKMLAVMEQANRINVNDYILSNNKDWLNNSIVRGVCHFLVEDGKLYWVKKNG